jgi:hypothetical protein
MVQQNLMIRRHSQQHRAQQLYQLSLHVHPPWLHQHRFVRVHDRQLRLFSRLEERPSPFAQMFSHQAKNKVLKMEA